MASDGDAMVQQLLWLEGKDSEYNLQGWTRGMKVMEEDGVEMLYMLVDQNRDQ